MHDIDFLPMEYRQKHSRRQSQPWQALVAIAMVGLVVAAAAVQHYRRVRLESDLAMLNPLYDAAVDQQTRLAETQKQFKSVEAAAELYTYLHHPWPRTQLLSALVNPLPEAITLQQAQISHEAMALPATVDARLATDPKAEAERIKSLDPAQRDLATLRHRLDPLQTVVVLTGTATETTALHRYIADLDATDIFDKAELDSFNSIDNIDNRETGAVIQFRAVLAVRPGYGQPQGPHGFEKKDIVQTN